jgi:hypothetical protein
MVAAADWLLVQATRRPLAKAGWLWLVIVSTALPVVRGATPAAERAAKRAHYAERLEELAAWCDEHGLRDAATVTRRWAAAIPHRLRRVYLPPIGAHGAPEPLPQGEPGSPLAQWHERFAQLRRQQADALFALARQAAAAGDVSLAAELLNDTLREHPDHADARRALQHEKYDGAWYPAPAVARMRRGEVWHDTFGYLPEAHVPRYEAGQRYVRGAWVSAARAEELHARIENGWTIETDHFAITTNTSLEEGVALGRRLEALHAVWRVVFAGYAYTPTQFAGLLAGRPVPGRTARRHQVMYFRTADEFRAALRDTLPPDVNVHGVYLGRNKTSYFYRGDSADLPTLFHEVTHQLFSELGSPVAADPGRESHFWIIEGVACYMESLTIDGPWATLGGIDAYRVQDARYYLLKDGFYEPLSTLAARGMPALQRDPQIARLYAQSAAWTDFLLHADAGAYRQPLMNYLRGVYAGRSVSLPTLLGMSATELDARYREYMTLTDDDLAAMARGGQVTYLALGATRVGDRGASRLAEARAARWIDLYKTQVTDAALAHLAGLDRLQQLDLSATAITDAGLAHLVELPRLQTLLLGATRITDRGMAHLARITSLEKLHLWNTNLTDAGVALLARLPALRELDLSGTDLTDRGLAQLETLRNLQMLDVSGTKVTAEGVEKLRRANPRLEVKH